MRAAVGSGYLRIISPSMRQNLAHVRRNADGSFVIHDLEEHLRAVGDLGVEGPR